MHFFIDSSKIEEVRLWKSVIDGATTNPRILQKDGTESIDAVMKEMDPLPVSVEVTSENPEDWEREARAIAATWNNAVVKIPIVDKDGKDTLALVADLARKKVPVNSTVCLSPAQIALAAKAGASFASLFVGRIDDEGGDVAVSIQTAMGILQQMQSSTRLIVASTRTVGMALVAMQLGVDAITLPPDIMRKMVTHQYSQLTSKQFAEAAVGTNDPVAPATRRRVSAR